MKRTLKQSQLENMISECVGQVLAESRQPRRQTMNEAQMSRYIQNIINEELENEGWFGDKWKQAKTAANTAFQNGGEEGIGLKDRFNAAKKNWQTQGELNGLSNLRQQLEQYVDAGQLNPQMTIAQLVGGKLTIISLATFRQKWQIVKDKSQDEAVLQTKRKNEQFPI